MVLKKKTDHICAPAFRGDVERRRSVCIGDVHLRTVVDQELSDLQVALLDCD
jgi:hypothetical protein